MHKNKKVELLAPAGSADTIEAALFAGADAVYTGGALFGARAYADNPDDARLLAAIDAVHLKGKKLYLTVNTLLKERELRGRLYDYLLPFYRQGLDGVIVQDFGVFDFIRKAFPDLPLHASTQMAVSGAYGAALLREAGAARIVTARELSLSELGKIRQESDIELEVFVHGALCYSYSGQCLFSSLLGGRSGNRGRCAQVCRLPYRAGRQAEQKYLLSPKDMMTLRLLPEILASGVASLKVEGRMKRPEYTAGVISIYRKYIDWYYADPQHYHVDEKDVETLATLFARDGFNEGYYHTRNSRGMMALSGDKQKGRGAEELSRKKEALYARIKKKYMDADKREGVDGVLSLYTGEPASLTLYRGKSCVTVTRQGVSRAEHAPLGEERIRAQMNKTGQTPYVFRNLEIMKEDDIFVPMQLLNELRREGLALLEAEELRKYRRETPARDEACAPGESFVSRMPGEVAPSVESIGTHGESSVSHSPEKQAAHPAPSGGQERPSLSALVESKEQLAICLDQTWIDRIYLSGRLLFPVSGTADLPALIGRITAAGKEAWFALPHISRDGDAVRLFAAGDEAALKEKLLSFIDGGLSGFLVRCLSDFAMLVSFGLAGHVLTDYGLYTVNSAAQAFLGSYGYFGDTVPLELNEKELAHRSNTGSEMIVYGYLPMMVSAQCLHKTCASCEKSETYVPITDRYEKTFYAQSYCKPCYNVIYNSLPLYLADEMDRVLRLRPGSLRLSFSIEDGEATKRVVRAFASALFGHQTAGLSIPITKGHFNRGVE